MDELQLLSELLPPAPPPSPEAIATARARLTAQPPARARLWPGRPRLWTWRPRPRGWAVAATAAAAVAALAAGTLTSGGIQAPAARLGIFRLSAGAAGAGSGTVADGRRILLTAARTVARGRPEASGRYWESPAVAGNFIPVGQRDDRYLIVEKTIYDQFMARSPRASSPQVVQQLSVELASQADRAAWRRAGSPTTWRTDREYGLAMPQGPSNLEHVNVTAGRDRLPFDIGATSGSRPFVIGGRALSARQLQALPAAPGSLRRLLLGSFDGGGWPGGVSSYLFLTVPTVLDMPVTPAVRSALYRMLATLPGVRSAGEVRDMAGQQGPAVTLTGRYAPCGHYSAGRFVQTGTRRVSAVTRNGQSVRASERSVRASEGVGSLVGGWMFSSCVVQQRLVINPVSGLPMAQELRYQELPAGRTWSAPGGLFSYEIFGTPHWTNALPRRSDHG